MSEDPLDVFVVEDNSGDIRFITEGIETSRIDCSLSVVTDGEAALDYLVGRTECEAETTPDLLLLDLNVPKKDGRTILEAIRSDPDLSTLPVVVLSGSESELHIRETYELGANSYFTKPVDPSEFIALTETLVESAAASGELPPGAYAAIDSSNGQ